jgi:hypothetical protein
VHESKMARLGGNLTRGRLGQREIYRVAREIRLEMSGTANVTLLCVGDLARFHFIKERYTRCLDITFFKKM